MLKKLSGYGLISVASFGFFTLAFHAVAHAQTSQQTQPPLPSPTQAIQKAQHPQAPTALPTSTPQVSPTPTIFIFSSITPSPTKTQQNTKNVTTTPPITPTTAPTTKQTTLTPIAIVSPPPAPAAATTTGLDAEKLFAMSNTHRQAKGLVPLQKDERTCSLAASRAPEIAAEIAAGTLHNGLQTRGLTYWNTENAIAIAPEEAAFNWWLNEPIHRQAIEGNHTYSCVACSGNYCVQEFTSYQPK